MLIILIEKPLFNFSIIICLNQPYSIIGPWLKYKVRTEFLCLFSDKNVFQSFGLTGTQKKVGISSILTIIRVLFLSFSESTFPFWLSVKLSVLRMRCPLRWKFLEFRVKSPKDLIGFNQRWRVITLLVIPRTFFILRHFWEGFIFMMAYQLRSKKFCRRSSPICRFEIFVLIK